MAKEITLPKLSEDAEEGSVAEVIVKEGDRVEKDEPIIAVESDKATVEVPCPEAGTVEEIKISQGDSIRTGDVILLLEVSESGDAGEDEDDDVDEGEEKKTEEKEKEPDAKEEKKGKEQKEEKEEKSEKGKIEETDGEKEKGEEEDELEKDEKKEKGKEKERDTQKKTEDKGKEIPAAPGARRLAREQSVDLNEVEGSGPDGLITEEDVRKAAGLSDSRESQAKELPDFSKWGTVERKSLSNIRKATARQTQRSWQTIPHVTQFDEAIVSNILEYIEEHSEEAVEKGGKLTITAVMTKMIANALHQFPTFNGSIDMDNEEVVLKKYVNIGIAADTDEGLLVPVVRDADQKSIIELAVEITELAEQAREGQLSQEDMKGGNFIISNLGGIGGTQFTPVIYHPNVAILGVSEITNKPVYKKESFEPRPVLPLSLSYDHRLIDGAQGARFLRFICNALEDPYKALLGR